MKKRVLNNPHVRRKLSNYFGEDSNDVKSNSTEKETCHDEMTSRSEYNLRASPEINHQEGADEGSFAGKNSTPTSEYVPKPRENQEYTPSTSLGGDSECLEALEAKLSRSPSIISNISTILNQIECSPSETLIDGNVDITLKPPPELHNYQTHYDPETASQNSNSDSSPGACVVTITIEPMIHAVDTLLNSSEPQHAESAKDLKISEFDTTLKPDDLTTSDSNQTLCCSSDENNCTLESLPIQPTQVGPENAVSSNLEQNATVLQVLNPSADVVFSSSERNISSPIRLIEQCTVDVVKVFAPTNDEPEREKTIVTSTSSSSAEILIIPSLNIMPLIPPEKNVLSLIESYDVIECVGDEFIVDNDPSPSPETVIPENNLPGVINETENKKTRKRKRNEMEWDSNRNKTLKDSGLAYKGKRSKKEYPAKSVGSVCNCKKKCGERITPEKRENIFMDYYKLANHEHQWQYIARNVKVEKIKRTTIDRKCNRTQTLKYYFPDKAEKIQVCKKFFLNTLSISDSVVYTALEKLQNEEPLTDQRGRHENRPHKTNSLSEESAIKHIKLFPTVEAHYVRKDSQKLYLEEDLNISKMYRLYKEWFAAENLDCEMASARQYRKIFNTNFNYSFFKPKKDLCALCTRYQQADEEIKSNLQSRYEKHIRSKEMVREFKDTEKENIETFQTIAIFDFQKVLYVPKSEVGTFYYKRKYPVYNFTVFDAGRKVGYCFMWHLTIAKRGAIEVGSCLLKFFKNEHERSISNISLYSDGCVGQNKNRFIFALHLYASIKYRLTITHRFFETGHSQNEGDSMHACIERELKKNKVLYTPEQVYSIAMNAKVSGEKYNVIEMDQTDFFNIKLLIEGQNWVHDSNGNKVVWPNIMEVEASHTHEGILKFKYNFDDEYLSLNTRDLHTRSANPSRGVRVRGGHSRRGIRVRGRHTLRPTANLTSENSVVSELQRAYLQPHPVPKALHSDLLSLCKSQDIPRHYHGFYESLMCETNDNVAAVQNSSNFDDNPPYPDD